MLKLNMNSDKENHVIEGLHHCVLELEEYVKPVDGVVAIPVDFVDYSHQSPQRLTETNYVPDLTQGELQPLEVISDDSLDWLDIDALIAVNEKKEQEKCAPKSPDLFDSQDCVPDKGKGLDCNLVPLLLKLHHPIPSAQANVAPTTQHFLPPVSDAEVDNNRFKRSDFWLVSPKGLIFLTFWMVTFWD